MNNLEINNKISRQTQKNNIKQFTNNNAFFYIEGIIFRQIVNPTRAIRRDIERLVIRDIPSNNNND